jgi:hypothetical protein
MKEKIKEKQLLLFDKNYEPILPEPILSNLSLEEKEELKKMQEVFKEFYNMDSDQMTNYNLWKTHFTEHWGDLNEFMKKLNFFEQNKVLKNNETIFISKLKINILKNENIKKLKTLKFLYHLFWEKNIYSSFHTNGIRKAKDVFNQFKKKKSIKQYNTIYPVSKIFKDLKITSFEEYVNLIKDPEIILALEKAEIIHKINITANP